MMRSVRHHEAGSVQANRLLLLLLTFALVACREQQQPWQTGDLVFVESGIRLESQSDMEQAIVGSTGAMVHVGIVEVANDSVFVIDAAPKTGVSRRPWEAFMEAQKDEDGNLPNISIMRLKDNHDALDFVDKAKSRIGADYDFAFLPDNGKYYCSELVYECYQRDGKPIFEAAPMNFRNAEGAFDPYWVELFEAQGMEIPQGVSGTNPDDLFHSPLLVSLIQ